MKKISPIRYPGGKGNMAKRLLPLLPHGKIYVEPFCGGASLFFRKRPHHVEVLNDLNNDVINLYRCLQDNDSFSRLSKKIFHTPYSRAEFVKAIDIQEKDVSIIERAWGTYVRHNQGFSGIAECRGGWGKTFTSNRKMSDVTSKWSTRIKLLSFWHERLKEVQIDCIDALRCIDYWDSPETVFYLDPPYILDTRISKSMYAIEPDNDFHKRLVDLLLNIKGNFLLSGYEHEIYTPLLQVSEAIKINTFCHITNKRHDTKREESKRTEVVWVKGKKQLSML